ncbi:uncharacterized protein LOC141909347 [Tubulanus polymorphus]|uniref:uncharacterized protein LOC141909347 n=1 Tax=Tubulanus polymorphus TaxID=672921 RepID=UPI003DA1F2DC
MIMDMVYEKEPGLRCARKDSVGSELPPVFEKEPSVHYTRKDSVVSNGSMSSTSQMMDRIPRRPSTVVLMEQDAVPRSKVESKIQRTVIKTLVYVLVIFLILYNTFGVTILLIQNNRRQQTIAPPTNPQPPGPSAPQASTALKQDSRSLEFCVPCVNISSQPSIENKELDKLPKKYLNGKQLCCADSAEHLMIILRRALDRQLAIERTKGSLCQGTSSATGGFSASPPGTQCVRENVPAAHMVGHKYPAGSEPKDEPGVVVNWAQHERLGFRRSISYKEGTGKLQIPKDGKYYVYSQIRFIEHRPNRQFASYINHGIWRFNPMSNHPELLLDRRQSNCQYSSTNTISEYSSYIGGIVQLNSGEELYVNVSNLAMVSQDPNANFFGLFYV